MDDTLNLTDEEIISLLKEEYTSQFDKAVLDLILRLKVENEKLKAENDKIRKAWGEDLQDKIKFVHEQNEQIEKLKAHNESLMVRCTDIRSAVRVVAEFVKIEFYKEYGELVTPILIDDIDKIVEKICGKE